MSTTPRLALPFLAPGQAQKEFYHNEALQLLDIMVSATVEEPPLATPPGAPAVGSCYLVGSGPSGEWSGRSGQLACFTSGGWRYVVPRDGMSAFVRSIGVNAVYKAGSWELGTLSGSTVVLGGTQVLGPRAAAIATPSGGSVADAQARATIGEILAAMRQHGLIEM